MKAAFEKDAHAFNLDGDGPLFMQDLDPLTGADVWPVSALFIEQPADSARSLNKDLFIKRDVINQVCLPCSAAALFTMQTNAPAGGRGHRTSLRGGGPLSTLISGPDVWRTLWLNTLARDDYLNLPGNRRLEPPEARYPWLGPARTSENGLETTPEHIHPDQMIWGMPRRIRLLIDEPGGPVPFSCDLCGRQGDRIVPGFRTRASGFNYKGPYLHPLTPHVYKDEMPLPIHGQPGRLTYRHWLGVVQGTSDGNRKPARIVAEFAKASELAAGA